MSKALLYSLLTVFLASIINYFFFHQLWANLNDTFFAAGGDGLKAYYGAVYHAIYDKDLFMLQGMNHPYGEHVLLTGNQWFLNLPLKMLGLENYVIGTMNFFMLASSVVSSLVIFLIFKDFKLNYLVSIVAAIGISYTSPQLFRMVGHFSLSYSFLLPLVLLFALRYLRKPSWRSTIFLAITLFACLIVHPYFFAMAALIIGTVAVVCFFSSERKWSLFYQVPVQIIIPLLVYKLLLSSSTVSDRTQFPWGFKEYQSKLSGIFYPFNMSYDSLFRWINPSSCNWEGISYVGAVFYLALVVFVVFRLILKREKLKGMMKVNSSKVLLTSALLGIVFSTGFILNYLVDHFAHVMSSFTQLRAIGRFAWITFYSLNIAGVVYLYKFMEGQNKHFNSFILPGLLVILFCVDGISPLFKLSERLNNQIPGFVDPQLKDESNKWLENIDPSNYQAVLTLPFFHVGSENIYKSSSLAMESWQLSLASGLPLLGVELSRTSLSQTHKSMALVKAPFNELDYLDDLDSKEDFLVIFKENELDYNERFLLRKVQFIGKTERYSYGSLSINDLRQLNSDYKDKILQLCIEDSLAQLLPNLERDFSANNIFFKAFETKAVGYSSSSIGKFPSRSYSVIFDSQLNIPVGKYSFSFWMNRWNEDVKPRTTVSITKHYQGSSAKEIYFQTQRNYLGADGSWALIEAEFSLEEECRVEFRIWNRDLPKEYSIEIDNFLLKPSDVNLSYKDQEIAFYNNQIVQFKSIDIEAE